MKWMIGTPLPASGLKPSKRIICTAEVESTVIAVVDQQHAPLIGTAPELLQVLKDAEFYACHQERACSGDSCVCGYEDWWNRFNAAITKAEAAS